MAPLTTIESKKAAAAAGAAASVEVLMNGSIFNDASFVMIWPLPFGHGAYLHRENTKKMRSIRKRHIRSSSSNIFNMTRSPLPRIPKRWCGYDWCDALIYPFISDLSHWCGGGGVRNSYHPTKSHVVGAFSRSWWEQKKECTTITYSNSTFVFEAFCSLESWHQNGRQLIMIHDWKHTHILKIKFQLVVTVMLVV